MNCNKTKSLMFVPATQKMLSKICNFNSDIYIIDLEDSINKDDKFDALLRCVEFLQQIKNSNIIVRVNKELAEIETKFLNKFKDIGIMLPKFENFDDYDEIKHVLEEHYTVALIETPLGLVNIEKIVSCEWIDAIAFGAEDYTAFVNMADDDIYLNGIKSILIANAKAFGKKVFDTPSFKLNNLDLFEKEVNNSVSLGFDGKMLITPKHIDYINQAFGNNDLDNLKKIISEYEKSGEAVKVIDGVVYEKMHIDRIRKIIKENGGN